MAPKGRELVDKHKLKLDTASQPDLESIEKADRMLASKHAPATHTAPNPNGHHPGALSQQASTNPSFAGTPVIGPDYEPLIREPEPMGKFYKPWGDKPDSGEVYTGMPFPMAGKKFTGDEETDFTNSIREFYDRDANAERIREFGGIDAVADAFWYDRLRQKIEHWSIFASPPGTVFRPDPNAIMDQEMRGRQQATDLTARVPSQSQQARDKDETTWRYGLPVKVIPFPLRPSAGNPPSSEDSSDCSVSMVMGNYHPKAPSAPKAQLKKPSDDGRSFDMAAKIAQAQSSAEAQSRSRHAAVPAMPFPVYKPESREGSRDREDEDKKGKGNTK